MSSWIPRLRLTHILLATAAVGLLISVEKDPASVAVTYAAFLVVAAPFYLRGVCLALRKDAVQGRIARNVGLAIVAAYACAIVRSDVATFHRQGMEVISMLAGGIGLAVWIYSRDTSWRGRALLNWKLGLLIAVAAGGVGWWYVGSSAARRRGRAALALREHGELLLRYQTDENGRRRAGTDRREPWPSNDSYLRRLMGDMFFDRADVVHLMRLDDTIVSYINTLGTVRHVSARSIGLTADGLDQLATNDQLVTIAITGADDDCAKALANLPHLRSLSLIDSQLTDDGIGSLAKCRNLRELSIPSCFITDLGVQALSKLQLQKLDLSDCMVSNAGLGGLTGQSQLERLDLRGTLIDSRCLTALAKLLALRELWITDTAIGHGELTKLGNLLYLTDVHVGPAQLDNTSFKKMGQIPQLKRIWIDQTRQGTNYQYRLSGLTNKQICNESDRYGLDPLRSPALQPFPSGLSDRAN